MTIRNNSRRQITGTAQAHNRKHTEQTATNIQNIHIYNKTRKIRSPKDIIYNYNN